MSFCWRNWEEEVHTKSSGLGEDWKRRIIDKTDEEKENYQDNPICIIERKKEINYF